MIVPSPELAAIARRFVDAEQTADGRTLLGLLLDSEQLRYIGTAQDEAWAGRFIREVFSQHVAEIPHFENRCDRVDAFENGETGWADWHGVVIFEGRAPRPIRQSWVFVLQEGQWRVAHCHFSFPVANQAVADFEHHAINNLLAALEEGDPDHGDEGIATIMFTDIANSTGIAAALGDRAWTRTISRHLETLTGMVEENGGAVVKTLGDGAMSSFGSTRQAMQAAISMQRAVAADEREPRLSVRIGLHTGDLIRVGGDFFGTVVNKAARIAAAARPGQILVSDAARVMVSGGGEFDFDPTIRMRIRGIEEESDVSPLRWQNDGGAAPD
jgi:class 3 adenylate cyclase